MKKKFSGVLLLLIFIISIVNISVSAAEIETDEIKIDIPEKFTIINKDNCAENKEYLESINFSEKSFKDYIENKSVILYATDKQGAEIVITKKTARFSAEIDDLYFLEEKGIREVFDSFLQTKDYSIVDCNNNRFLQFEYSDTDKGGEFSGFQLVTVKNGDIYTVNYTASDKAEIEENLKLALVTKFEYTGNSELSSVKADTVITIIILILAIIVFVGVAVYIVYTFVKQIKERKEQSDVAPYVKIKRRKF